MNPSLEKQITHLEQEVKSLKTKQNYILSQVQTHVAEPIEFSSINATSQYLGEDVDSLYAIVSFHGVNSNKKAIARPLFAGRVQSEGKLNFMYYPIMWHTYQYYDNVLTYEIYATGYDTSASETKPFDLIFSCRANMPGTMKLDKLEAFGGLL